MKYLAINLPAIVSVAFAGWLCYSQNQYWPWFLGLSLLMGYSAHEGNKDVEDPKK